MGLRKDIMDFLWHARPRRFRLQAHPTARLRAARIRGGEGCTVNVDEYTTLKCQIVFPRGQGVVSVGKRSIINESVLICADRITIGDFIFCFINDNFAIAFFKSKKLIIVIVCF